MFAFFTLMHLQAAVFVADVCSQLPHGSVPLKVSLPYMLQKITCLGNKGRMQWMNSGSQILLVLAVALLLSVHDKSLVQTCSPKCR